MLGYFHCQDPSVFKRHLNSFIDFGKMSRIKADIQNRADDLGNLSFIHLCHFIFLSVLRYRFRTCNDFGKLLGNGTLSCTVVKEG